MTAVLTTAACVFRKHSVVVIHPALSCCMQLTLCTSAWCDGLHMSSAQWVRCQPSCTGAPTVRLPSQRRDTRQVFTKLGCSRPAQRVVQRPMPSPAVRNVPMPKVSTLIVKQRSAPQQVKSVSQVSLPILSGVRCVTRLLLLRALPAGMLHERQSAWAALQAAASSCLLLYRPSPLTVTRPLPVQSPRLLQALPWHKGHAA